MKRTDIFFACFAAAIVAWSCKTTPPDAPQVVKRETFADIVEITTVPEEAEVFSIKGEFLGVTPYTATARWERHIFDDDSVIYMDLNKGIYVREGARRHLQFRFVLPGGQRVVENVSWDFHPRPQRIEKTLWLHGSPGATGADGGVGVVYPPGAEIPGFEKAKREAEAEEAAGGAESSAEGGGG